MSVTFHGVSCVKYTSLFISIETSSEPSIKAMNRSNSFLFNLNYV